MTDRKLTEAEMISYLELSVAIGGTASLAPEEAQRLLDLINRQKVEIERLKNNPTLPKSGFINLLCGALIFTETLEQYNKFRRTFKSEAVKEFAQNFESKITCIPQHHFTLADVLFDLDKLVKEMTEGKNGL